MTESAKKLEIANRTNQIVEALLNEPELDNLSDSQFESIVKSVVIDNLKDKLKNEIAKSKVDKSFDKLKSRWLNKFESAQTRRSFEYNLGVFLGWLSPRSIVEVDALIVDDYIYYLKNTTVQKNKGESEKGSKISDNTLLQRIASVSSFFKDLVRWEIISINPFLGVKRPKKQIEIKDFEKIPSDKELDKLEEVAFSAMTNVIKNHATNTKRMNQAGKMAYLALKILRQTGLRVGALPSLKIDKSGYYVAKTKGSTATGILDTNTVKTLIDLKINLKQPFKSYTKDAFSMWLHRKTDGKFMPHSIRHKFAVDFYKKTKDIVALSRALGHKTTMPTQSYLATLKVEI